MQILLPNIPKAPNLISHVLWQLFLYLHVAQIDLCIARYQLVSLRYTSLTTIRYPVAVRYLSYCFHRDLNYRDFDCSELPVWTLPLRMKSCCVSVAARVAPLLSVLFAQMCLQSCWCWVIRGPCRSALEWRADFTERWRQPLLMTLRAANVFNSLQFKKLMTTVLP